MVYLTENSTKVLFPRISSQEITLITFTNQITKEIIECTKNQRGCSFRAASFFVNFHKFLKILL
nr:hypothetical protein ELOWGMBK_ELOWGMBK_CDS_0021 [Herelleviridae sp.]CAI9751991.1 hypothetical protein QGKEIAJE_QGKEIAJE_CDS_0020 [uncultured phage]